MSKWLWEFLWGCCFLILPIKDTFKKINQSLSPASVKKGRGLLTKIGGRTSSRIKNSPSNWISLALWKTVLTQASGNLSYNIDQHQSLDVCKVLNWTFSLFFSPKIHQWISCFLLVSRSQWIIDQDCSRYCSWLTDALVRIFNSKRAHALGAWCHDRHGIWKNEQVRIMVFKRLTVYWGS